MLTRGYLSDNTTVYKNRLNYLNATLKYINNFEIKTNIDIYLMCATIVK